MTGKLRIIDRVGDVEINNIVRQHEQSLLAAGIEKLEIHNNPDSVDNPITLSPGKLNGYWTGDKRAADQAMQKLQEDLEKQGISSKVIEHKFPPAEIFVRRPPPPSV